LRKLPRTKTTNHKVPGVSKPCKKIPNQKQLWNLATAVKCHLLPAMNFIRSANVTAKIRTVTDQTKAGIFWAMK